MKVQKSEIEKLSKIAECHKSAFRNSISSKLGSKYIIKMLEWYIEHPKAILSHIEEPNLNLVIGYMAIVVNDNQISGSTTGMVKHTKKELVNSIISKPWLLFHKDIFVWIPFFLRKMAINLKLIKPRTSKPEGFKPSLSLVIIGISEDFQRKGLSGFLLNEMEKYAKERKINRLTLSVRRNNLKGINAYKNYGWSISKTTKDAHEMEKLISF